MPAADSSRSLTVAVFDKLDGDATLGALVTGVFDHVPDEQDLPYVTLDGPEGKDWSAKDFDGMEHSMMIHSWSEIPGWKEVQDIMSRVHELLHDVALTLSGFTLVNLRFESHQQLRDPDGVTRHGVQRFRAVTHP